MSAKSLPSGEKTGFALYRPSKVARDILPELRSFI
jgi:hypothetical protein